MKTYARLTFVIAIPLMVTACNQSGGGVFGDNGLFGSSGESSRSGTSSYVRNGQCDDPCYNTSHGGKAEAGTDEYDCSRHGGGLKR
jgi:hypothetical protein